MPPPAMDTDNKYHPFNDERYKHLPPDSLPDTESLLDCRERVLAIFNGTISKDIYDEKKLLIVVHSNCMRAIVMHLEGLSELEIETVEFKTAIPVVYTLDHRLKAISKQILDGWVEENSE